MKLNSLKKFMQFNQNKKYFTLILFALSASFKLMAQVVNSGNLNVAGNMYVNYTFINNSTADYRNNGIVYFTSDFINNQASMVEGTGTTNFVGTSLQKLNGSQAPVFHDVSLSNTNGLQMNVDATMGGTISPVSGKIYFNDYALSIGGKLSTSYTNTSFFNVTNKSDIKVYGSASSGGNLYFDPTANTIHNVTVTSPGSAVIGNALNVTAGTAFGTVVINGALDAANKVTLKSDANGTARIGNSAGTITHFVTVERYIPPRRAWRFMAVNVDNDTLSLRTAWQEGVNNDDMIYTNRKDPYPGFGTDITGGTDPSIGTDYSPYSPSIKTWIPTLSTWTTTPISTLTTKVNSNSAYCLFVRGSRAVHLEYANNAVADPTILRLTGNIYNGTHTKSYPSIATGTYLFVGNPYASSVDLANVVTSSSGINTNKFYVWDPAFSGNYGVGGYVTYDNGLMVPITASYPSPTTIIQGNQGFIVQSNATSASIVFHQSDKTASESKVFGKPTKSPHMYFNLLLPSADTLLLVDGTAVLFDDRFSNNIDADDAIKIGNFNENIAMLRFDRRMAIETRPNPVIRDTLFLRMSSIVVQTYALEIMPVNIPSTNSAILIDKYLNTKTSLKIDDTTLYRFTANTDTASYMRRFIIVYGKNFIATPHAVSQSAVAEKIGSINIYPNPVKEQNFVLNLKGISKGSYKVIVYSNDGKALLEKSIQHSGGSGAYTIRLQDGIASGLYTVYLMNNLGETINKTSLIVSKE